MGFLPTFDELAQSLPEPASDTLWIADIQSTGVVSSTIGTGGRYAYNGAQLRAPNWFGRFFNRIEEIPLKYRTIDSDQRFYRGRRSSYPRWQNVESISLTFYESDNYDMLPILTDWMDAVVSRDGVYSPRDLYVRDIHFYAFNNRDRLSPVIHGIYESVWPTSISEQVYQYGSQQRVRWNVAFEVYDIQILKG